MIMLLLFAVKNFRVYSDLMGKGKLLEPLVRKEIRRFSRKETTREEERSDFARLASLRHLLVLQEQDRKGPKPASVLQGSRPTGNLFFLNRGARCS